MGTKARPEPPDSIFWVQMGGTCIAEASYDIDTTRLWIRFVNGDGTAYSFIGVPKWKWEDLKKAKSKGTYYHKFIEGRYRDG